MSLRDVSAPAGAPNLAQLKRLERKAAEARRAAAHGDVGGGASARLAQTGLEFLAGELVEPGGVVSGFAPFGTEIDVVPLLARLTSEGWVTALPVVVAPGRPLAFRRWAPGEPTVPGRWGIPVPHDSAAEILPDILLVPMLAFDRQGYRLGYGGGYYDRTIAMLRQVKTVTAIGIAYAGQEIAAVPRGRHDQPLDWILTERGVVRIAAPQDPGG